MKLKEYNIESLFVVRKCIDGVNEAFICEQIGNIYQEVFTKCFMYVNSEDTVEELSNYFPLLLRIGGITRNKNSLLHKYNEINHVDFLCNYDNDNENIINDVLTDADDYNKWHNLELLKK